MSHSILAGGRGASRRWLFAHIALSLTAAAPSPAFAQQGPSGGDQPPPAVTVQEVERTPVNPSTEFPARVEAVDTVELQARVQGYLEQRLFEEGAEVEEGQLLFTIEKAPYEAALAEAEAAVASAQAELKLTAVDRDRQAELVERDAVAQARLDEAQANYDVSEASVKSAKATADRVRLDLQYTEVRAPIAGRIGRANYSVGDLVGPNDAEPLATIVSVDPIYVVFSLTQRQLIDARRRMSENGFDPENLRVRVRLADGNFYDEIGRIGFLGNRFEGVTDSITARARFPNPDGGLVDGQVVTAVIEEEEPDELLTVPQRAVQLDQIGRYVLTVDDEGTVQQRRVEVGEQVGPNLVVRDGLEEGDRVITEGLLKAQPGQKVNASTAQEQQNQAEGQARQAAGGGEGQG